MWLPWRRAKLDVWYHPSFRVPLSSAPDGMDPRRADNVLTWLVDRRIVDQDSVHEAPEATWQDLRRVHADRWLEQLDDARVVSDVLGVPVGHVPVGSIVELWRRGVGASVEAARHVVANGGRAATLMGGFHHAAPDRGSGFCGLNDLAVAVAMLREDGYRGRIAVLDLDAHPPDGLAAFELPGVEIRSVGVESAWEAPVAMDLRVPPGAGDDVYLRAVDRVLDHLWADLVLYIAGSDPLDGDAFGSLAVSEAGLRERDRRVFATVGRRPCVVVPGGGYTRRSWRVLAHSLAECAGRRTSVPASYAPVTRRMRQVMRSFPGLEEEPLLTEAEVEEMFGRPTERRFLGHFTRHTIEHALDRYGLLGALRRLGFGPLELEVSTGSHPERIRVFGRWGGQRCRLIDLAVALDRLDVHKVLRIDWLELTDPRREGVLPGQAAGSLGVAQEIGSILTVTAQRMGLAGLMFTPSHYHVAFIARNQATLLDPVLRGRFQAVAEVFAAVPLQALSAQLEGVGLPTEDGEVVTWEPGVMIQPLDPALEALLVAGEVEARAVRRGTRMRLLSPEATFG